MKHIKDYNSYNESILLGMGITALSLLGINKLLSFINKKMRDSNVKSTLEMLLHNEENLSVKIEEISEKFIIKITNTLNDFSLDLTLDKNTKELISVGKLAPDETGYILKLSETEYKDLLTIIEYYQTKWVNNPKW